MSCEVSHSSVWSLYPLLMTNELKHNIIPSCIILEQSWNIPPCSCEGKYTALLQANFKSGTTAHYTMFYVRPDLRACGSLQVSSFGNLDLSHTSAMMYLGSVAIVKPYKLAQQTVCSRTWLPPLHNKPQNCPELVAKSRAAFLVPLPLVISILGAQSTSPRWCHFAHIPFRYWSW